ncbi:hypothetical protein GS399_08035 [Pedobacter sp. HMF7647]|uniref:tRNA (Guanine-N1)-methyltransferase n=1 Tax=Hufsiella arboris TaxID=2695275 RepID=A0A7K1Y975_9SPHI|nr:hypothetical protein [Hufsiella arboris]MXV50921.1 hypothetical protein [Hufsiella arboris]
MKSKNYLQPIFTVFLLCLSLSLKAQDTTKVYDPTLKGQYKQLLDKSKGYPGYKIISQAKLDPFLRNYADSLKAEKRKTANAQKTIADQKEQTSKLQGNLNDKNQDLEQTNAQANSISLLGFQVNKSTYSTIVWSIIAVLAIALAIIIFKSIGYKNEASYRIKLFNELSEEFQSHKMKANEKEKKLARELQDERNKLEELNSRNR